MFPQLIASLEQANVSRKRLQKFLNGGELDTKAVQHVGTGSQHQNAIVVNHGVFTWGETEEERSNGHDEFKGTGDNAEADDVFSSNPDFPAAVLRNIKFEVPRGSLVAVLGTVGCGKSSLLSALLGEMVKLQGTVLINGTISYVPQQAWMKNASVKDNILFGKDEDPLRYQQVLEDCALIQDLKALPAGDQTEIGEKGINLSGGQKQRISLARAVYADTDVLLLDDPLSAVDSNVAKHLFTKVLSNETGCAKRTTRILVTNSISFLPQMDKIIVLTSGEISEMDTYKSLVAQSGAFAEFINNFMLDKDEKQELEKMDDGAKSVLEDCIKHRCGDAQIELALSQSDLSKSDGAQYIRSLNRMLSRELSRPSGSIDESPKGILKRQVAIDHNDTTPPVTPGPVAVDIELDSPPQPSTPKWVPRPVFTRLMSAFPRTPSGATLQDGKRPLERHLSMKEKLISSETSISEVKAKSLRRRLDSDFARQMSIYANDDQTCEIEDEAHWPEEENAVHSPTITKFTQPVTAQIVKEGEVEKPQQEEEQGKGEGDGEAGKKAEPETAKLIQEEKSQTGKVKLKIFLTYAQYIGVLVAILIIVFYALANACSVLATYWLSRWSDTKTIGNALGLGIYTLLGLLQSTFLMLASFTVANGRISASKNLHANMLSNILRSPLHFFDTTPTGRITNRFSKDVDMIDNQIPSTLSSWLQVMILSLSTIIVISINTPLFLISLVPLSIIYFIVQRIYVATSRQLKRMDAVSRSPIYSHFGETVQGAVTIRAFGQQCDFILEQERRIDENQKTYFHSISANRWLAVRLEFVGNIVILVAALLAVWGRHHLSDGTVGLSIMYAMNVTTLLNLMVRFNSDVETSIVAVERVKEYTETATEKPWIIDVHRPPSEWPSHGQVVFKDYATKYRPDLPRVVDGLTFTVQPGEKLGIVGRTGAGKSSLTLGLFRIVEPDGGQIFIDSVDVYEIGLHDLRSKLTIIPQDPVLFAGSLKFNLDPFETQSDDELWQALEQAHMKDQVMGLPEQLNYLCSTGGENLSVGQRQLVCLARALLRKTQILVMDEATAAIDMATDELIQQTIRTKFSDCTVLTIAHRLNTIMDYDRILVLDSGKVAELDTPQKLKESKGLFYRMAKDAGLV